jgi:hypothetical protein
MVQGKQKIGKPKIDSAKSKFKQKGPSLLLGQRPAGDI